MIPLYNAFCNISTKKSKKGGNLLKLSKREMIEFIKEALETADEYTVQQVYEFLQEAEY